MALPADFNKIFGSTATGGLTPISDVNYAKGWEFVGSNPPTKNDFSYLQNLSDLKSQWLYSNKLQRTDPFGDIKSDGAEAISTALTNLGIEQIIPFGGDTQYVDNTASRMSDVIYTNTHKKAMLVCISFIIGSSNAYMDVTVDSAMVCRVGTTSSFGLRIPVTFVVPPGKTYKAKWFGNSSNVASWVEIV